MTSQQFAVRLVVAAWTLATAFLLWAFVIPSPQEVIDGVIERLCQTAPTCEDGDLP